MIAALLLSSVLVTAAAEPAPPTREGMIRDMTDRLLSGEDLPRDLDEQLMHLSPADRIEVLIFLRRSGMLLGPGWSAERLLAPEKRNGTPE